MCYEIGTTNSGLCKSSIRMVDSALESEVHVDYDNLWVGHGFSEEQQAMLPIRFHNAASG